MATPTTVRRVRAADLDRIEVIERACFGEEAYDRNLFAEFFDTCGDLFLVAERAGRVCGYIIACRRARDRSRAELVSLAVQPAARGRGTASALLESTMRRLRRRGVERFSLMVRVTNEAAQRLYEKYGFRRMRSVRRYYEDGEDGFLMGRALG